MNRGKDENKAKRRGIHSSASTEQISSRQKVLESFEEMRMTPDERKAETQEEFVSLHFIYCDCERCRPVLCVHCGQPEKNHYYGATGIYCIGFYDNTKKFTPAGAAAGGESRAQ